MSTRQPPRRLGAILALLASVLLVLSLILPMLVISFSLPGVTAMTTTISAWGPAGVGPAMTGDGALFGQVYTHAIPMLFATLLLVVATVIAFVRAGSGDRPVMLWLTAAAAFASGVAITVVGQVTSWMAVYEPPFGDPMGTRSSASIGLGFWVLAAGAVVAVAAAGVAAMPVRKPEAAEVPAPPAAESTGVA